MARQIVRLVDEEDFLMTDQEHRNLGPRGIDVWYGFENGCKDVSDINSLARAIRKDFPKKRYSEMEVSILITSSSLGKIFFKTCLKVRVHVNDFITLRKVVKFGTFR